MPYLDRFRLRWWSKSLSKPGPPGEDDSDRSSSSERVERRLSLHIGPPTNPRHSADRARNIHHASEKPLPATNKTSNTIRLSHDESLNEKSDTPHLESHPGQATDRPVNLLRSTTIIHNSLPSAVKPSLIRRVTSKLRITVPANGSPLQPISSGVRPSHSRDEAKQSSQPSPRATLHHSRTLPDDFLSRERREAALRERGLRPPRKDLSEQEREADQRLAPALLPDSEQGESSAASKIKEEWLLMNRSTETRASGTEQLDLSGVAALSDPVCESLLRSSTCDSDCTRPDLKAEIPFVGRSSTSSSALPLSQSSHLEVLQEEPAEHVPPTSSSLRAQPPIVISTPVEDSFLPNSPVLIESPTSCSSSYHLAPPGSFSQQHPPSSASPDKESSCSQFPAPPARRRATNLSNRSRASVGASLSKFGTNSLTNLRRSVIGSIRHSGSSADLSTSSSQPSSPRMAISPTIHNRESIMFEASGITDAESRRLSELAFLD